MAQELELEIKEIIPRSYNVKSFRLRMQQEPVFEAGQFLCAKLLSERECKRYLSISSSPTEKGYIEFTKKITQSDFSKILISLKPEDRLRIEYPFGNFTLKAKEQKIAFLSGGIGITPIRSICKYAVDNNLDADLRLIYANKSIKEIIFKEDFDRMQRLYPRLKVAHVLCEPAVGFKCVTGLINAQVVRNEIPDYESRKFYVCGPPSMVSAMKDMLIKELSVPLDNIVTENFQGY